jgi:HEPN domain-containing protein
MSKTLTSKIAFNAVRLAADARLLFENKRYPTALSLAVLSLEESGKYYLISRNRAEPTGKELKGHLRKQSESAWFAAEAAILAYFEILSERGYEHKPASRLTVRQIWWLSTPEGQDFWRLLNSGDQIWPDGAIEVVAEKLAQNGTWGDYRKVATGELNLLKQAGFYVDDAERGIGDTEQMQLAEKWLRRAEIMSERAARDHTISERYMTALRDDLITGCPF